jgi:hypothetical protein
VEYILRVWHPIGHSSWTPTPISCRSVSLLAACRVYYQRPASYWSLVENILSVWHPICRLLSIYSAAGILLAIRRVYSQCMTSYWPLIMCIRSAWHPSTRSESILSGPGILLATRRVYSHEGLASYGHS